MENSALNVALWCHFTFVKVLFVRAELNVPTEPLKVLGLFVNKEVGEGSMED